MWLSDSARKGRRSLGPVWSSGAAPLGNTILQAMVQLEPAAWWHLRRASNRKPATYRCPLCGGYLTALSEHMLMVPEGDSSRRRHGHTDCVIAARREGRLPTKAEWQRSQPRPLTLWRRISERLRARSE
jgi:hypothetical protein